MNGQYKICEKIHELYAVNRLFSETGTPRLQKHLYLLVTYVVSLFVMCYNLPRFTLLSTPRPLPSRPLHPPLSSSNTKIHLIKPFIVFSNCEFSFWVFLLPGPFRFLVLSKRQ